MEDEDIDETLVSAVHDRPILWQKSHKKFADKILRSRLWKEIKSEIGHDFTIKQLQGKWQRLQAKFYAELNKMPKPRSGDAAHNFQSTFSLFEQMMFLKENREKGKSYGNVGENDADYTPEDEDEVDENLDEDTESTVNKISQQKKFKSKKCGKADYLNKLLEVEERKIGIVNQMNKNREKEKEKENSNADLLFLKSLLPDFEQVPQHLKGLCRQEVIGIINKYAYGINQNFEKSYLRDLHRTDLTKVSEMPRFSHTNDFEMDDLSNREVSYITTLDPISTESNMRTNFTPVSQSNNDFDSYSFQVGKSKNVTQGNQTNLSTSTHKLNVATKNNNMVADQQIYNLGQPNISKQNDILFSATTNASSFTRGGLSANEYSVNAFNSLNKQSTLTPIIGEYRKARDHKEIDICDPLISKELELLTSKEDEHNCNVLSPFDLSKPSQSQVNELNQNYPATAAFHHNNNYCDTQFLHNEHSANSYEGSEEKENSYRLAQPSLPMRKRKSY